MLISSLTLTLTANTNVFAHVFFRPSVKIVEKRHSDCCISCGLIYCKYALTDSLVMT